MLPHQWNLGGQSTKFIACGFLLACLVAALILATTDTASYTVLASDDEATFVSNQAQNRQGEIELRESPPEVGQIFTTGGDLQRYELIEITGRNDNTSPTHESNLKGALHLVTSDNKPGTKAMDMTGTLRERKTNHWSPAGAPIMEPLTEHTLVWPCNAGTNSDQNCDGGSGEIEIELTNSDSEDIGKSSGRSVVNDLYREGDGGIVSTGSNPDRVQASESNSGAPSIVSGGVQMYEVQNAIEAAGWGFRAPGDDAYGNVELIVVSVEFSAPVRVNGKTTFRIQIGSANRGLVLVSLRDNTVLFGSLIRNSDEDTDGVWIGDNAATLGHNPAGYIQSNPDDGSDPVNADLTHASLGTQSNHKVKGSANRPKILSVRVASSPQYEDTYIRGETIEIEATFSQPVVVSGNVGARIATEAFQTNVPRFAGYARGSGTSKLVFEYSVGFFDVDLDGIAIPANSLAQDGDLFNGVQGGGSISGKSGGLLANLTSSRRDEDVNHKIDTRLAAVPEVMTAVLWDWEAATDGSSSVEMDFNIREDPGHFSEDQALVLVMSWGHIDGIRFAYGLRTDVDKPGTDGSEGKGVIFNRWGTVDTSTYGRAAGDGWVEAGNFGGPFISARRTYDWSQGNYSVRIAQDGDDDADGRWFGLWITDKATGVETHMGSLKFPMPDEGEPEIQARNDVFGSLIAIVGNSAVNPTNIPVFEAGLGPPDASDGDLANEVTVSYSLLNGVITNGNVRYDADTGKVIMRVGGSTKRITQPGTTISGIELPLLTAGTQNAPQSHDGQAAFTFELTFSEEPGPNFSYKTLKNHAFTVTGGSVINARRLDPPNNIRWEISVQPASTNDVVAVLPVPDYCGAQGAFCTADGRELSSAVNLTVPGPGDGN